MKIINWLRTGKVRSAIMAGFSITILLVLPHWGAKAMMVGSALSMVVYCFIYEFTPGPFDPHGTRAKAGFIALTLVLVAAAIFMIVQPWFR